MALAISNHPAALVDDCARAHILVLTFPCPPGCNANRGPVIDFFASRAAGTISVFIEDGKVRTKSVAQLRGDRPWARSRDVRRPLLQRNAMASGSRLGAFAAPCDLTGGVDRLRPEIEDEDPVMDDREP